MIAALVVVGLIGVLVLYGLRLTGKSNPEKVAVLSELTGWEVKLEIQTGRAIISHTGTVLRTERGQVVVRERSEALTKNFLSSYEDRTYPISAILEIEYGGRRWGPW